MAGAMITDLTHFLDEKGAIAPPAGPARSLAEFLTRIVAEVTGNIDAEDSLYTGIHCRRRPARKPCGGLIEATFTGKDEIGWRCTHCDDHGTITHWQNSFWDLMNGLKGDP
jgi:hypothetical protein